nr:MAG TPA: hypothetical protein [Caudoviricetes sp.]
MCMHGGLTQLFYYFQIFERGFQVIWDPLL